MAAVEVTISGILYDKFQRTTQHVVLIGDAVLTGVGIGGGPMPPGPITPPGSPPGIWGPPGPWPTPPIHLPPGSGGGQPPGQGLHPEHPIVIVPPNVPNVPPAGSPPVIVPGTQPVQPITPPSAVVIEYPGIGKVVVPQPTAMAGGPVPV